MNKTPRLSKYLTALLGICMAFLLAPSTLLAATLWWDASGGASWGVISSWSTTGGGGSNPAAIPGA